MRSASALWGSFLLLFGSPLAGAFTLTFDDIPPGQGLYYYWEHYGVGMSPWRVVDHSQSSWGPPHSGNMVLAGIYDPTGNEAMIKFSHLVLPGDEQVYFSIYSLGAYFSTEFNAMVRMVGYHGNIYNPIATAYIGARHQSWTNQ